MHTYKSVGVVYHFKSAQLRLCFFITPGAEFRENSRETGPRSLRDYL